MRIAIVGSHGTGKTTLGRLLTEYFNWRYIPDLVPRALQKGFTINEETPSETQFWILSKELELERNLYESWISEKSLWDNIIYADYCIKDKEVISVITKIVEANARYNLVLYLPIEFPLTNDGVRSQNPEFQSTIDKKLVEYMKRNGIEYHTISGSIDERFNQALDIIKSKL